MNILPLVLSPNDEVALAWVGPLFNKAVKTDWLSIVAPVDVPALARIASLGEEQRRTLASFIGDGFDSANMKTILLETPKTSWQWRTRAILLTTIADVVVVFADNPLSRSQEFCFYATVARALNVPVLGVACGSDTDVVSTFSLSLCDVVVNINSKIAQSTLENVLRCFPQRETLVVQAPTDAGRAPTNGNRAKEATGAAESGGSVT